MNHAEIKERIHQNLAQAALDGMDVDIRVQPDPFSGWRIAVISSGFQGKSQADRKEVVLDGLEDLTIQWLDLLTPQEREWTGSLPIDSTLENLPLWPEALAQPSKPECILFPSDLDDDLEKPIIATFYSLRGGVGRSTALAYTARILASRGQTVLCIDMDLEAPGLAALFGKEQEVRDEQGLVYALLSLDQGEQPDLRNHILRISDTDELYCLPAGLPNANYARALSLLDPSAWYREDRNPLHELIQNLSTNLSFQPDVILLDARTGITPLNGPLLFDLADLAIIVFFPHPQAQIGTGELVRALLAASTKRTGRRMTPEPRFIISPVPASKAPEVVERYRHRAIEWISNWLSVISERRSDTELIKESEVTHFIPYREEIATSDRILVSQDTWRDFYPVAEWLERFIPTAGEQRSLDTLPTVKKQILQELEFSAGTAESHQSGFLETFVETDLVQKALTAKIPLILGRKGTGKTAIFRRLLESSAQTSVVVLCSAPLTHNRPWIINSEGFQEIDRTLSEKGKSWRDFWLLQLCLACHLSWDKDKPQPQPDAMLAELLESNLTTELEVIRCLEKLLQVAQVGLLARDWITRLDRSAQSQVFLLIDGLDTGFGNTQADRQRRKAAIEGLLSLVTDLSDNLENLKFKILLREDIWRTLQFDNKSHFFGRSVTLTWSNTVDFIKVLIKQALQSNKFKELVASVDQGRLLSSGNYLSEQQVFEIWNILVGERMRGGKSAFTRNWVWNRIADGSNNHSPRALLQLFFQARDWESRVQEQNTYWKTVIRPRALSESLEEVSKRALDALINEEFPELEELINRLREIGRSPFKATEINGLEDQLVLARDVGLLSIYEGTETEVERYKVPDLYLSGIGMIRKGQA
jgi:cellulose biosynthesis protein BcsQ